MATGDAVAEEDERLEETEQPAEEGEAKAE
jgi:hypothetical protein